MKLIPEWHSAHKLWTIQLAAFWGFVGALFVILPVFLSVDNFWLLGPVIILIAVSLAVARVLDQPGLD